MTKRITFVVNSFPTFSETFIVNHIVSCIKEGFDVRIVAKVVNDIDNSSQKSLIAQYSLMEKVYQLSDCYRLNRFDQSKWLFFSLLSNLRYLIVAANIFFSRKKYKLKKWQKFLDALLIFQGDIVHIHFADNGSDYFIPSIYQHLNSSIKTVTTFHGYDAHFTNESKLLYLREKYFHLLDKVDVITVNSEYLRSRVAALGATLSKVSVVPIPVDVGVFNFKKKPEFYEPIKLLSVGRLERIKGHLFGIKVVHQLITRGYQVKYKIIGEGSERVQLMNLIHEYDLSYNIELLGNSTQETIVDELHNSFVMLFTSTKDENKRMEAFGLASVEAQSTGTPVIAFNTGGVSDTLNSGTTGILVEDKNIDEMTNSIIELLNDSDKYKQMCVAARVLVEEKFDVNVIKDQYLNIYHD